MSVQRWWADVILVDLPEALDKHHELQTVIAMLRDGGACDVVVDGGQASFVGRWT
jgi:hypothetical protein